MLTKQRGVLNFGGPEKDIDVPVRGVGNGGRGLKKYLEYLPRETKKLTIDALLRATARKDFAVLCWASSIRVGVSKKLKKQRQLDMCWR